MLFSRRRFYADNRKIVEEDAYAACLCEVSPEFQITIPEAIREQLGIQPGQKLLMYMLDGDLHISVRRDISELQGIAKGLKWSLEDRDRNDRY